MGPGSLDVVIFPKGEGDPSGSHPDMCEGGTGATIALLDTD